MTWAANFGTAMLMRTSTPAALRRTTCESTVGSDTSYEASLTMRGPFSGKSGYGKTPLLDSKSTAWEFFTDDEIDRYGQQEHIHPNRWRLLASFAYRGLQINITRAWRPAL